MSVVRRNGKWAVIHTHPKKPGSMTDKAPGTVIAYHETKAAAMAQHRAIEASKARMRKYGHY